MLVTSIIFSFTSETTIATESKQCKNDDVRMMIVLKRYVFSRETKSLNAKSFKIRVFFPRAIDSSGWNQSVYCRSSSTGRVYLHSNMVCPMLLTPQKKKGLLFPTAWTFHICVIEMSQCLCLPCKNKWNKKTHSKKNKYFNPCKYLPWKHRYPNYISISKNGNTFSKPSFFPSISKLRGFTSLHHQKHPRHLAVTVPG